MGVEENGGPMSGFKKERANDWNPGLARVYKIPLMDEPGRCGKVKQ